MLFSLLGDTVGTTASHLAQGVEDVHGGTDEILAKTGLAGLVGPGVHEIGDAVFGTAKHGTEAMKAFGPALGSFHEHPHHQDKSIYGNQKAKEAQNEKSLVCENCGIRPRARNFKYCSHACFLASKQCAYCKTKPRVGNFKYCGKNCASLAKQCIRPQGLVDHSPNLPPFQTTGEECRAEQSKRVVDDFIGSYLDTGGIIPNNPLPYTPAPKLAALPVGIIGAGVAGLYIGMMLDTLGIKYEIMEGSGRIGGRLYTHKFPNNQGKYQYCDIGAMRYPNTLFMQRTFDLVQNRLNMPDAFIPYIYTNPNSFVCYNDISVRRQVKEAKAVHDVFRVSSKSGGNVPQEYVSKGADAMWWEGLKELRENFKNMPFKEAYNKLMEYEEYSVSSYLQLVKRYPIDVINWFQTVESRTGLLDEALSETVLASLVFNDPKFEGKPVDWFCLDGGSEIVPHKMVTRLSVKPVLHCRATVIEESDDGNSITVTFKTQNPDAQAMKRTYSNVISTMSFGCLRMVDLRNAGLNYGQKNAIKDLIYTSSCKVAMQFKTAWWERLGIVGGQSSTDLPIRDCVYPSYGPDDSHDVKGQKSNCMIVSYTGMQDSQRLAGLMHGKNTLEERAMLDLIMRNLAQLHKVDVDMLWDEFEDYHPWDFHADMFQLGAFAQFGPGQLKYVYPYLQQPAGRKQRLHFAGDATSFFHGWVAGALNSAWRAVMGMLIAHPELNPNNNEDIIKKFEGIWGESEELDFHSLCALVNIGRSIPVA